MVVVSQFTVFLAPRCWVAQGQVFWHAMHPSGVPKNVLDARFDRVDGRGAEPVEAID
jgi:hypothetical protein